MDRTDTPKGREVRVTFDPRILTWGRVYTPTGLEPLGAPLTGDTIGAAHIPTIARLQQDARTASGVAGFVASLGAGLLVVRHEERITPLKAEVGLTDRLSLTVSLPIIRTDTRTALKLSPTGASLGVNPFARGDSVPYNSFFSQFDTALAELADSIGAGHYGCGGNPQCAAQALLNQGLVVRDALYRTAHGVGPIGSPFMPRADSDAGLGIVTTISGIQQQLQTTYNVAGFTTTFLLPTDTVTVDTLKAVLQDPRFGFDYNALQHHFRYGLGDLSVQAKYRVVSGARYAMAWSGAVRLPTGSRDSTLELMDVPLEAHQLAFEGAVIQELTVAGHLWLNLAVRAGTTRPSTQARRVAPFGAFLVPLQATTVLNWDSGDYLAVDFAPLYRLTPRFALGVTAGYFTKRSDRYSYRTAQDSIDLAGRVGFAPSASVLDQGTSQRWLRGGIAVTYTGARVEGGFTVERTLSGAGGLVPAATVFRLVMRMSKKLF